MGEKKVGGWIYIVSIVIALVVIAGLIIYFRDDNNITGKFSFNLPHAFNFYGSSGQHSNFNIPSSSNIPTASLLRYTNIDVYVHNDSILLGTNFASHVLVELRNGAGDIVNTSLTNSRGFAVFSVAENDIIYFTSPHNYHPWEVIRFLRAPFKWKVVFSPQTNKFILTKTEDNRDSYSTLDPSGAIRYDALIKLDASSISCVDSDGDNRYVYGNSSGLSEGRGDEIIAHDDYCSDSINGIGAVASGPYLHEYVCENNLLVGHDYSCNCANGACVLPSNNIGLGCMDGLNGPDSDGGQDIYNRGAVYIGNPNITHSFSSVADYCSNDPQGSGNVASGPYLHEYDCTLNLVQENIRCESGCSNGACICNGVNGTYVLHPGDTVNGLLYNLTLLGVSDDSALFDVGGDQDSISIGDSISINGMNIFLKDVFNNIRDDSQDNVIVSICAQACSDSDYGENLSIQGTTIGRYSINSQLGTMTDACDGASRIREYSCNQNVLVGRELNCPQGTACLNGACVPPTPPPQLRNTCIGPTYSTPLVSHYVKTSGGNNQGQIHTDECLNGGNRQYLWDYSCTQSATWNQTCYSCLCQNGKCINSDYKIEPNSACEAVE